MNNKWQPMITAPKDGSKFWLYITGFCYKRTNVKEKWQLIKEIETIGEARYYKDTDEFDGFFDSRPGSMRAFTINAKSNESYYSGSSIPDKYLYKATCWHPFLYPNMPLIDTTPTTHLISKKLTDIGLLATPKTEGIVLDNIEYNSYDLDTLISVLPPKITRKFKNLENGKMEELEETLIIRKNIIYYSIDPRMNLQYYIKTYNYYTKFSEVVKSWESESFSDTAGRLLIQLFEAGYIKFNKKK